MRDPTRAMRDPPPGVHLDRALSTYFIKRACIKRVCCGHDACRSDQFTTVPGALLPDWKAGSLIMQGGGFVLHEIVEGRLA